jgi:hypothetical protein
MKMKQKESQEYMMGGSVKKYMDGGKVSKGKKYKQSVRGAGCATQGVRNAKMR